MFHDTNRVGIDGGPGKKMHKKTKELKLIEESNYSKFPPRLPEQPIFYPVLTEEYAIEIASGWNAKYNDDHKGYVTKFEIDDTYCGQFEIHQVGDEYHKEFWIPAERLEEFNLHIVGKIDIINEFSSHTKNQNT